MSKQIETCEDTSKSCLVNLANAGVEEAVRMNSILGFTAATRNKAVIKATAVFQEMRYQFINYYVRRSGYKNILDVGCGYSPRTLVFVPEGYKYVGLELPKVTEAVSRSQKELLTKECYESVRYESVKLTDIEGIERAAEGFEGPVCITIEGVLMYFTAAELDKMLTAFRNIISKRGGCIVTPDYMTNMMMKTAFTTYAGPLLGNLMLKASYKVLEKYTPKTEDEHMDPVRQFADDSDEYAKTFFERKGFKITRVPMYVPDMPMVSLESNDKKAADAREKYSKLSGWIAEV